MSRMLEALKKADPVKLFGRDPISEPEQVQDVASVEDAPLPCIIVESEFAAYCFEMTDVGVAHISLPESRMAVGLPWPADFLPWIQENSIHVDKESMDDIRIEELPEVINRLIEEFDSESTLSRDEHPDDMPRVDGVDRSLHDDAMEVAVGDELDQGLDCKLVAAESTPDDDDWDGAGDVGGPEPESSIDDCEFNLPDDCPAETVGEPIDENALGDEPRTETIPIEPVALVDDSTVFDPVELSGTVAELSIESQPTDHPSESMVESDEALWTEKETGPSFNDTSDVPNVFEGLNSEMETNDACSSAECRRDDVDVEEPMAVDEARICNDIGSDFDQPLSADARLKESDVFLTDLDGDEIRFSSENGQSLELDPIQHVPAIGEAADCELNETHSLDVSGVEQESSVATGGQGDCELSEADLSLTGDANSVNNSMFHVPDEVGQEAGELVQIDDLTDRPVFEESEISAADDALDQNVIDEISGGSSHTAHRELMQLVDFDRRHDSTESTTDEPFSPSTAEIAYRSEPLPVARIDDYRKLKSRIENQIGFDRPAVVGFVSVDSNSDVADVVANVGELFAETDAADVLLLDGNFCRRILSDRFDIRGRQGFTEILCDDVPVADAVHQMSSTDVSVVPAGTGDFPRHGSALRRIPGLIGEWKEQYAKILVDLGSADDPSTHEMIRWCDVCYFVLPLGMNTSEEVTFAVESLRECGAKFMGAVLTNAEA